jgi:hypothetical protein
MAVGGDGTDLARFGRVAAEVHERCAGMST